MCRETVATKLPDTERVMLVSLALGPDGGGEEVRPLLLLVFYLLDKIKRLRLSKEVCVCCHYAHCFYGVTQVTERINRESMC